MKFPIKYWLKGENLYERREQLKKKYTFADTTFSQDFMNTFVRWFFLNNLAAYDASTSPRVYTEAKRLLNSVYFGHSSHEKSLNAFCDLIKLDRTAWKVQMYQNSATPCHLSLQSEAVHGFDRTRGSSRPYGTRWSKRLAIIPAEFDMNNGCFGASKYSICC